jgi:hypothetical protein
MELSPNSGRLMDYSPSANSRLLWAEKLEILELPGSTRPGMAILSRVFSDLLRSSPALAFAWSLS